MPRSSAPRPGRITLGWLLLAGAASANEPVKPFKPRPPGALSVLAPRLDAKHAPQVAPVPPGLEIEVLDPGIDPLGNPASVVVPTPGLEGRSQVDVPRSVLVHKFYYTGDRSFQGPFIPGGPSTVVVNHPQTGERLYLEVAMLPGAPRVTYSSSQIEYDFGPQAITISFGHHGQPRITTRQGVPRSVKAHEATAKVGLASARLIDRTGLPDQGRAVGRGLRNVATTTADRIGDLNRAVTGRLGQAVRATPLGGAMAGTPESRAAEARDDAVARTQREAEAAEVTIPTIR